MENETNELVPFMKDTLDIGSIVLEKTNIEGEKVTHGENSNTLMSNYCMKLKVSLSFK